jgi:hypothetical protein
MRDRCQGAGLLNACHPRVATVTTQVCLHVTPGDHSLLVLTLSIILSAEGVRMFASKPHLRVSPPPSPNPTPQDAAAEADLAEAFGSAFVEALMVAAFEGLPALGGGDSGSAQDGGGTCSLALRARPGGPGGDKGSSRDAALRDLLRAVE